MAAEHLSDKGRGIYEDPQEIDPNLWKQLSSLEVDDVCDRASVRHSKERECYLVPFLNRVYACYPCKRFFENIEQDQSEQLSFQFYLVLITYLLRAQAIGLSGRIVTDSEIQGGDFFFRGPHALFTGPLEKRFGHDIKAFLEAGLRLGGSATDFGDVSIRLWPLPRIPLEYILWAADEEFPARLVITFDATVDKHLPLDAIWALVNEVGRRLLKAVSS
jgi:hypothetical protein